MTVDESFFFDHVRRKPFGGRLATGQVGGLGAILKGWTDRAQISPGDGGAAGMNQAALAYVLATAYHETAATMQPVRETLASTDADAILRLDKAYAAGRLKTVRTPYWRPDADGRSWLGRGFVQLTHKQNYEAMSGLTGIDLVADPGRAMEVEVAVTILIDGMRAGSFTGARLRDYFSAGRTDFTGARRIINGTDRAARVAGYANLFYVALSGKAG